MGRGEPRMANDGLVNLSRRMEWGVPGEAGQIPRWMTWSMGWMERRLWFNRRGGDSWCNPSPAPDNLCCGSAKCVVSMLPIRRFPSAPANRCGGRGSSRDR